MNNFRDDILRAAQDEPIEAIVIGNMGWPDYGLEDLPERSRDSSNWNKVLTWEQAEPLLNYNYDCGYGAPSCQAVAVWTATKVLFVVQYDGSTGIESVPRHPIAHVPTMPGG